MSYKLLKSKLGHPSFMPQALSSPSLTTPMYAPCVHKAYSALACT